MKKAEITAFAKKQGYEDAEYLCDWCGYACYEPIMNNSEIGFVGLPLLILVKDGKIRMSTPDEAMKQLEESD